MTDYNGLMALVADDHSFIRGAVATMMEALGFSEVVTVGDGTSALKAMAGHRPAIVLCDIRMTPMDGLAFLKALRTFEAEHDVKSPQPVILMTSNPDASTVRRAMELDVDAFLVKPVTPESLRKQVDRVLKARMSVALNRRGD